MEISPHLKVNKSSSPKLKVFNCIKSVKSTFIFYQSGKLELVVAEELFCIIRTVNILRYQGVVFCLKIDGH